MPIYHFDVHTAVIARDEEGLEFPDLCAAKASAVVGVRSLIVEEMRRDNRFSPNHSIQITNAVGQLLHTTRYSDCLDICF
jgi:hypothetical protein